MKCDKLVQKDVMPETRTCCLKKGHKGSHTPDLTGLRIHRYAIVRQARSQIATSGRRRIRWWVKDRFDHMRIVRASDLFRGKSTGLVAKQGSGTNSALKNGKTRPEYGTWHHHLAYILNTKHKAHKYYCHLSVYDGWNPQKGGSFESFFAWIQEHLGPKPKNSQLHIIPTNHGGKGFGPWKADDGGWSIRWITRPENLQRKNQYYVEYGNNKDFAKEAKRRGFKLVPLS